MIPGGEVVQRYLEGESIILIAKGFKVGRPRIRAILDEAGVKRRTHVEALRIIAWSREKSREWCRNNPQKQKASKARRRARETAAVRALTEDQWLEKVESYGQCCAYCGLYLKAGEVTQDHVVPLVKGGDHTIENVVPACLTCNLSKGVKLMVPLRPDVAAAINGAAR